jgi:hypothetical protein
MNPLRLLGIGKPREPKPADWRQQAIEDLRAWRQIGQEFTYCGRTLVVTGHWEYSWDWVWVGILADYADDLGVIRQLKFSWLEARALMESQP